MKKRTGLAKSALMCLLCGLLISACSEDTNKPECSELRVVKDTISETFRVQSYDCYPNWHNLEGKHETVEKAKERKQFIENAMKEPQEIK